MKHRDSSVGASSFSGRTQLAGVSLAVVGAAAAVFAVAGVIPGVGTAEGSSGAQGAPRPAVESAAPARESSTTASSPKATTAPKVSVKPSPAPTLSAAALEELATTVQEYGLSRPEIFVSVQLDLAHSRVLLTRVKNAGFDAEVDKLKNGRSVTFRNSVNSLAQLRALRTEVMTYAEVHGIEIAATETPLDGRALVVKVSSDLVEARRVLADKFGNKVDVDPGEVGQF